MALGEGRTASGRAVREGARKLRRRAYFVGAAVVLVVLAIAGWFWASRPSSAQVAAGWGLPGIWQRDCEAPLRADNPRYAYSIEDGKVLLRRDFGRDLKDTSEISDVETTPAGELRYVVRFVQLGPSRQERATRQNVLAKAPDGRIRAVANKHADTGEESVVKGIRIGDNNPTPWMRRCKPG